MGSHVVAVLIHVGNVDPAGNERRRHSVTPPPPSPASPVLPPTLTPLVGGRNGWGEFEGKVSAIPSKRRLRRPRRRTRHHGRRRRTERTGIRSDPDPIGGLAEGVGFEPTKRRKPLTRFPGVRTRPDYAIPPGRLSVNGNGGRSSRTMVGSNGHRRRGGSTRNGSR